MRHFHRLLVAFLLAAVPQVLYAQHLDPALMGNWTLSVSRSSFGPDGAPTSGVLRWTQHGWVLAMVFPTGFVYADAVVTDRGCALIGIPADYTCSVAIVTPMHVRFTLKQGASTRRVGDIELLDQNTTRTVHRVTPASGSPYTETTIWIRDAE
jgi:hypothetical protein